MAKKELEDNQLSYIDDNGKEVVCEILFTFHSDDFNKDYVLFYPIDEEDEDGRINVRAASYVEQDGEEIGTLDQITNDDEWTMIEEMLDLYEQNNIDDDEEDDEK